MKEKIVLITSKKRTGVSFATGDIPTIKCECGKEVKRLCIFNAGNADMGDIFIEFYLCYYCGLFTSRPLSKSAPYGKEKRGPGKTPNIKGNINKW